jgi:hypothetical protein
MPEFTTHTYKTDRNGREYIHVEVADDWQKADREWDRCHRNQGYFLYSALMMTIITAVMYAIIIL